ncbi:MAG: UDP-N-acetylglucosamine 2-epimerase (non-hydrolyzing) [Bacteroidia bacterium]|nr:UDP-N-acetylglucosamine 2-epimerase (non-hydrolyzing) [Bacteroidia bacterium]
MKRILTVVGTRPNFIKVTQFNKHFNNAEKGFEHKLLHTGQHYDDKMSKVFFEQFNLIPDFWLNISSGTPNTQMAKIMMGLEETVNQYKPDLILVVGDVNSTFAAALTANKMGIKIGHIESGLRSEDRTMPEEINRILTDKITDCFFVTEQSGTDNLLKEGIHPDKIFFTGNTMIDTLVAFDPQIQQNPVTEELGLKKGEFVLMTMHRPATVDSAEGLNDLLSVIEMSTARYPLVFPIHPRTLNNIEKFGLKERLENIKNLILAPPMDYFAFQKLIHDCKYVITDSGGIQEETTYRRVPCITLRPNTERPVTVSTGTNTLAPFDLEVIREIVQSIEQDTYKKGEIPPFWDGNATLRISESLNQILA